MWGREFLRSEVPLQSWREKHYVRQACLGETCFTTTTATMYAMHSCRSVSNRTRLVTRRGRCEAN